jgi:SAM-dependent methyltransferase
MSDYTYVGSELALFANALHWKRYWRSQLHPYVRGAVLEVGAGNGNNTKIFQEVACSRWVCVEPDSNLCAELKSNLAPGSHIEVVTGTLSDVPADARFDTILYIDVLEHIEHDAAELELAARRLAPQGQLVVLGPAHQFVFSPFDKAVGHWRRYSRRSLQAAAPSALSLVFIRYLDSAGLIASLGNRLFLKHAMPTETQLRFWDNHLVPISRYLDPALGYHLGKSVVAVWRNAS